VCPVLSLVNVSHALSRRSIKDRTKNRSVTVEGTPKPKSKDQGSALEVEAGASGMSAPVPEPLVMPTSTDTFRPFKEVNRSEPAGVSSLSAKSVMSWFRSRSLSKRDSEAMQPPATPPAFDIVDKPQAPLMDAYVGAIGASSSSSVGQPPVQVIVTTPNSQAAEPAAVQSKTAQSTSDSGARQGFANLVRNVRGATKPGKFDNTSLRIHHGAVDHATVTSGAPPEVFAHVTKVLLSMGLEVQKENNFKYRCIRPKKPKTAGGKEGFGKHTSDAGSGYTAFTLVGSAASNGVRTNIFFYKPMQ
jgi:protein-serine/threonine kinase